MKFKKRKLEINNHDNRNNNNNINRNNRNKVNNNQSNNNSSNNQNNNNNNVKEIPGYYYDKETNRYFKITNESKQLLENQNKKQNENKVNQINEQKKQQISNKYINKSNCSLNQLLFENELYQSLASKRRNRYTNSSRYSTIDRISNIITKESVQEPHNNIPIINQFTNIEPLVLPYHNQLNVNRGLICSYNGTVSIYPIGIDNNSNSNNNNNNNQLTLSLQGITLSNDHSNEISRIKTCKASPGIILISNLGNGNESGSVSLYNCTNNSNQRLIKKKYIKDENVWTSEWHPNGKSISIGGSDSLYIWDLYSDVLYRQFISKSDIFAQDFNHSGTILYNGSRNGQITSYDLRMKDVVLKLNNNNSNNSDNIDDITTSIWLNQEEDSNNSNKYKKIFISKKYRNQFKASSSICSLRSMRSDDNYLLVSTMSGELSMWDQRVNKKVINYQYHNNSHSMLRFSVSSCEQLLCSAGEDKFVRLWNLNNGSLLKTIGPFNSVVKSTQFLDEPQKWLELNDHHQNINRIVPMGHILTPPNSNPNSNHIAPAAAVTSTSAIYDDKYFVVSTADRLLFYKYF